MEIRFPLAASLDSQKNAGEVLADGLSDATSLFS